MLEDKSDVERFLYSLSRGSFDIFVPQLVLGEAVSRILAHEKCTRDAVDKLVSTIEKYRIDVRKRLVPVQGRIRDHGGVAAQRSDS